MSDTPTANKIKAQYMVAHAIVKDLSPEVRTELEDAIDHDLDTALHHAVEDGARLEKLEAQVHALSDAIVVIAEPSPAVDGAVQAVKDTM